MSIGAVLLAPGAGSSSEQATLVAVDAALSPLPVERMDFPYRLAGRRAPDRAPVLMGAVRAALHALCERTGVQAGRVAMGGRSMGGRISSMVVAEDHATIGVGGALVLISYPLHPPAKPEKSRTAHLGALDVPCLFVSGDRDPFGAPDELRAAAALIPGPVTHHWIAGGRHGLEGHDVEIAEVVDEFIRGL